MDAAECPAKIAEILTAKYGGPVIDEPSREMYSQNHKRVWIDGETKISEFSFFFPILQDHTKYNLYNSADTWMRKASAIRRP